MSVILDREVTQIVKNLNKLGKAFDKKELRKVSVKAARPLVTTARNLVPVGTKKHYRYYKNGGLAATYSPGNLKRSIGVLRLKNTSDVYVGPRATRGKKSGDYSGRRVDGYYAHFIEYGVPHRAATPFMRPAFDAAKTQVKVILVNGLQHIFDKYHPVKI